MKVRLARSSEYQALIDIYRREGLFQEVSALERVLPKEFLEIDQALRIIWFAESEKYCVGSIQLVLLDPKRPLLANGKTSGMVHHLRVEKNEENHGIASLLYGILEATASKQQLQQLTLEIERENVRARTIYEHWGFRYFREGDEQSEIVMRKLLQPDPPLLSL